MPQIQDAKKPYIFLYSQNEPFIVEMGSSANGNAKRIMNKIKGFHKVSDDALSACTKANGRRQELETALSNTDDGYIIKLRECEAEAEQIKKFISMNQKK